MLRIISKKHQAHQYKIQNISNASIKCSYLPVRVRPALSLFYLLFSASELLFLSRIEIPWIQLDGSFYNKHILRYQYLRLWYYFQFLSDSDVSEWQRYIWNWLILASGMGLISVLYLQLLDLLSITKQEADPYFGNLMWWY